MTPGPGYLLVPRGRWRRSMLPVSGIVAAFFFLRGHNAPGGGFVAGLVMAMGFLLQYIVFGTDWVEDRVRLAPRALIGVGLLLVLGTARRGDGGRLSAADLAHLPLSISRWSARFTSAARCSSTSACSAWCSGPRC